ncbi:DNA-processing protein DprA [Xylanibacter ruminicola]|uniref:DNA processing protein n=1 Tax=Xylanibacter ruminicola TaxID=839 RepID=A0A1M6XTU7_XYLRU|nr:DNA-processing protein DprA [Xylanibacter ruminicola]SHL09412.1 DNA processing protein [Xylanibacter ruminicola]
MNQETFYAMALTRLTNFNFQQALELYKAAGSAQNLYEHRNEVGDMIEGCTPRLVEALKNWGDAMKRAEVEAKYMEEHKIRAYTLLDDDYPQRLLECADAPLVLYYIGNADLNQTKIISIVGTRQITSYGKDICRKFIRELHEMCPQVLIVSGLAYGVDICAHRESLANGYDTLGVLAHGLDQIYPYHHRDTAAKMVEHGGLLTEFMTQTNADKVNFVRRNRIVAGISDATIVIESAAKGGSLITAEIAQSYDRAVFAFPGNVNQPFSEGCNNLIRDNGAGLISNAEDFVKAMGWQNDAVRRQALAEGIERQLFPELSPEEQKIVSLLQQTNDLQLNIISVKAGFAINQATALLFQLEMKGVVKPLAGGMYHLLM